MLLLLYRKLDPGSNPASKEFITTGANNSSNSKIYLTMISRHPFYQSRIPSLPIEHNSSMNREVRKHTIDIPLAMMYNKASSSWAEAIETNCQSCILRSDHDLREQIGHHLFSDTIPHRYFPNCDVASYKIVPNC